jgi:hypothetical protein
MAHLRILTFILSWLVACSLIAHAQGSHQPSNPTATIPSDTDPRISTFNQPHMSWLPTSRQRNQLLVFLPGTGGEPRERFPFTETAAALGYHVISLMYPDSVAAQQVCARSDDPGAYMKFRLAIIQGGEFPPIGTITQADSIVNRLTQLLRHLSVRQPNCGWDQYLDRNQQIDWSKVAVSGQSQGGGHAYVISKYYSVARVLCFGSPKDYSFRFMRPAEGFDGNTRTPLARYFAFNHMRDTAGGCNHDEQLQIFQQIGLTRFGSADADRSQNFNHAHLIYTDAPISTSNPKAYHGSVIKGALPICVPVWTYMLTEPVQ